MTRQGFLASLLALPFAAAIARWLDPVAEEPVVFDAPCGEPMTVEGWWIAPDDSRTWYVHGNGTNTTTQTVTTTETYGTSTMTVHWDGSGTLCL